MTTTTRPQRLQLRRTKGWRNPAGAIYVGRPSIFGNPFTVRGCGTPEEAVERFRHLLSQPVRSCVVRAGNHTFSVLYPTDEQIRRALAGRDLLCFCPPGQVCHADILLEVLS